MAAPKPITVVLILAVFACVALYVLGVGLGVQDRSEPGSSPLSEEVLKRWRDRLFSPEAVAPGELRAVSGCALSAGRVEVVRGRECQVDIGESDARLRVLEVEPLGGSAVDLRLEVKGRVPVEIPVEELDESTSFHVLGSGATLTLECRRPTGTPARCRVRLR
jgi:hypothetical protein